MDAYDLIKRELAAMQPAPKRLLEIGAGGGSFLQSLVDQYQAVGVGVDPYTAEQQTENISLRRLPAEDIASLRQWFDVVFSVRAFHHFTDPFRCLQALPLVIGWGGRCLLVDWHAGAQTGIAERYYTLQEAADMVERAGLRVLSKKRIDDIFIVQATLSAWKIAVAVNEDEQMIFPKMFGQAPKFAIYHFSPADGIQLQEIRPNIYEKTLQHQKTFDVYDLVHDCQAVLSARIGKRGLPRLQAMGVKLYFSQGAVQDCLQNIAFD